MLKIYLLCYAALYTQKKYLLCSENVPIMLKNFPFEYLFFLRGTFSRIVAHDCAGYM